MPNQMTCGTSSDLPDPREKQRGWEKPDRFKLDTGRKAACWLQLVVVCF